MPTTARQPPRSGGNCASTPALPQTPELRTSRGVQLTHPPEPRPRPTQMVERKNVQQKRQAGLEPGMRGGTSQPFDTSPHRLPAQLQKTRYGLGCPDLACQLVRGGEAALRLRDHDRPGFRVMSCGVSASPPSQMQRGIPPPSCPTLPPPPAQRPWSRPWSPQPPSAPAWRPRLQRRRRCRRPAPRMMAVATAVADSAFARKDCPLHRVGRRALLGAIPLPQRSLLLFMQYGLTTSAWVGCWDSARMGRFTSEVATRCLAMGAGELAESALHTRPCPVNGGCGLSSSCHPTHTRLPTIRGDDIPRPTLVP
jgi:hypothetical protein